jgi:hypothetical protein
LACRVCACALLGRQGRPDGSSGERLARRSGLVAAARAAHDRVYTPKRRRVHNRLVTGARKGPRHDLRRAGIGGRHRPQRSKRSAGRRELQEPTRAVHAAFTEIDVVVNDLLADGSKMALRWTLTGTLRAVPRRAADREAGHDDGDEHPARRERRRRRTLDHRRPARVVAAGAGSVSVNHASVGGRIRRARKPPDETTLDWHALENGAADSASTYPLLFEGVIHSRSKTRWSLTLVRTRIAPVRAGRASVMIHRHPNASK